MSSLVREACALTKTMMELSTQQATNTPKSLNSQFSRQWMSADTPTSQNINVPVCEKRSGNPRSFDCPAASENGFSHNITRMLSGHHHPIKEVRETVRERSRAARYSPYDAAYTRPSKKTSHQIGQSINAVETEISASTDSDERRGTPNTSDCSMSSLESLSPISFSSAVDTASPTGSGSDSAKTDAESATSHTLKPDQKKKLTRTNYTKEQLKTLMKLFQKNPYPDSEMMENIAKDFAVKDTTIKIWFQNKRARWRRRVEKMNNSTQSFTPSAPLMSPYVSYGYPYNQVTSQQVAGYQTYQWMQTGALGPNNNNLLPAVAPRVHLSSSDLSQFPSAQPYPQMVSTTSYPSTISSSAHNCMTSQMNVTNYQNNLMYSPHFFHGVY